MRTAIDGVIVIALLLAALGAIAAVSKYFAARELFDIAVETEHEPIVDLGAADDLQVQAMLEADEADHVARLAQPKVIFVPDGFTCLGCGENPALPFTIWCAVCNRAAWASFTSPQQPIEWGKR